ELPFPIQRVQTDCGMEFFACDFQQKLMDYAIKFRPIKPRSPHLNGKVERSQKTDWDEFYSTVDLTAPDLNEKLGMRVWRMTRCDAFLKAAKIDRGRLLSISPSACFAGRHVLFQRRMAVLLYFRGICMDVSGSANAMYIPPRGSPRLPLPPVA